MPGKIDLKNNKTGGKSEKVFDDFSIDRADHGFCDAGIGC
jgi:hypothetical protein